jgi:hypothetical protein
MIAIEVMSGVADDELSTKRQKTNSGIDQDRFAMRKEHLLRSCHSKMQNLRPYEESVSEVLKC